MSDRPDRHFVLMSTARAFSLRSTCSLLNVGAVASRDGRILVTGYNGAPARLDHCHHAQWSIKTHPGTAPPPWVLNAWRSWADKKTGHSPESYDWRQDNGTTTAHWEAAPETDRATCLRAVHAEANVVAFAARHGVSLLDAQVHVTHMPCLACAMLLINAGVERVVYDRPYRITLGVELLKKARVSVSQYTPSREVM